MFQIEIQTLENIPNLALNVTGFISVGGAVRGELLPSLLHESVDSFAGGDQELFSVSRPDTENISQLSPRQTMSRAR